MRIICASLSASHTLEHWWHTYPGGMTVAEWPKKWGLKFLAAQAQAVCGCDCRKRIRTYNFQQWRERRRESLSQIIRDIIYMLKIKLVAKTSFFNETIVRGCGSSGDARALVKDTMLLSII